MLNDTDFSVVLKAILARRKINCSYVSRRCLLLLILFPIVWYLCLNFEIEPNMYSTLNDSSDKTNLCARLSLSKLETDDIPKQLPKSNTPDQLPFKHAQECHKFRMIHGLKVRISRDEVDFPLAYSINVYENANQVARLLRLIYRPHNLYCIHVDAKAVPKFWYSMIQLAECFGPNVILVPLAKRVNVRWGYYSLLESDLICARYLLRNSAIRWRYLLNLSGKEMPLKTNWELVSAIRALNGSNMVEAINASCQPERIPNTKFTFNFTWVKGSFLTVLRREFVQFMLTDPKALTILDAFKHEQHVRKIPDELYFSTLAYNPQLGAPGSCTQLKYFNESDPQTYFLSRFVKWGQEKCPRGLVVHGICILTIKDMPDLVRRPELFANKFFSDYEPLGYDCLEDWMMNKMVREWQTNRLDPAFNIAPYSTLYCSQNHLEPDQA